MGTLVCALVSLPVAASPASGQDSAELIQVTADGVTVDWGRGTLRASGGAAADLRMPSVDVARPGAERRARATALAKLRDALAKLPLGGGRRLGGAAIERALGRARTLDTEYQSNGGAIVRLEIRFADWIDGTALPSEVTLAVPETRLAAAPEIQRGGRLVAIGAATYHFGPPPPTARVLPARLDAAGRLVIEGAGELDAKLAASVALIYVRKLLR